MSPAQKTRKPAGPLLPGVADAVAKTEAGKEAEKEQAAETKPEEDGRAAVFFYHLENFHRDAYDAGIDGTEEMAAEARRAWLAGDRMTALVYQYEILTRGLLARIKNAVDMAETAGLHVIGPRGRAEMRGILEVEAIRFADLRHYPESLAIAERLKAERPAWIDPDAPARHISPMDGLTILPPEPPRKKKVRKPKPKPAPAAEPEKEAETGGKE